MKNKRPLVGGSIDVEGVKEWKAALKQHSLKQVGSLRGYHVYVHAVNQAGEIVGCAGHQGHGDLRGFISSNHDSFKTDWIDEIVRFKEQLVENVERWKATTPEMTGLGEMHETVVQRHVAALPAELASCDLIIEERKYHLASCE